jgi:broad specificity phosphatase PhoE
MTRLTLICDAGFALPPGFPDDAPLPDGITAPAPIQPADKAWSSPQRRARQTATLLGLTPAIAPALRDCDYGRWRGRSLAEVGAQEPDALAAWLTDPAASPHGGESVCALVARVGLWLDERSEDHGHHVAVTHGAVIRAAIVHALRAGPASCAHIDVAPWSRTLLSCHAGTWRLRGHELRPDR